MQTTLLYVELLVIGLEPSIWMFLTITYFTDLSLVLKLIERFNNIPATIFILGLLYIIGMIFDRASDQIFKKFENRVRKISNIKSKSTLLIWKKYNQEDYYYYSRTRIRILRSSCINIPIITLLCILNGYKYFSSSLYLTVCISVFGIISALFSFLGYRTTLVNYYNKARVLELFGTGKTNHRHIYNRIR